MKRLFALWIVALLGAMPSVWPGAGESVAQSVDEASAPGAPAQLLSAAELDQLTAPIALYSDPLLGSVLAAATYPLEVVEAARWRDDPANAALTGEALSAALQQQSWDASVKSLVQFPDVLRLMNDNLQWTEQLGEAFLAQQADVMDSVQRLRQRAAATGALQSTPQQTVAAEGGDIAIEPSSPDLVYTPYYDPASVYGPWPWPGYPPYYFATPPGVYFGGGLIGFGIGIGIVAPLWGWYGWDWPHHGFTVRPRHGPPGPPRQWWHDPAHRGGVPYRDPAVAGRYLGAGAGTRQGFRGFPPPTGRGPSPQPVPPATRQPAPPERAPLPAYAAPPQRIAPPQRSAPPERFAPSRPAPPAFESFGRGSQVRSEAGRGSSSRSAPAPRAEPPPPPRGGRPPHS
jgi:hypothetical protein